MHDLAIGDRCRICQVSSNPAVHMEQEQNNETNSSWKARDQRATFGGIEVIITDEFAEQIRRVQRDLADTEEAASAG